ncbi:MAG: glycoside hydrolase, partial [Sphingomonadales bacterium]
PPTLVADFAAPRTVSALRLYAIGAAGRAFGASFAPVLEASDDDRSWHEITRIPLAAVPTTLSFAPVTARHFRMVFKRSSGSGIPAEYAGIMSRGLDMGSGLGAGAAAMMGGSAGAVKLADFKLYGEPRVDQAETKAAFAIARDYYALGSPPEARGVPVDRVLDLTARMRADGTLDWTPPRLPKGERWRVLRIGHSLLGTMNHPAPVEATGLEVDKFDAAAVRRYMEHYLGLYRDTVGSEFIGKRGVRAFLTDSIEAGAANWTPRMIDQFKARRGYDPLPWLPALTGTIVESRARTDAFLYDYRRTLSELMASEHYGTVAAVAHEHGLTVYSEAQEDLRPNLGDDMAMRRYADVPMAALWAFDRTSGPKPTYLADTRGAASVANIYGKPFVAAESLTSLMAPWAFGPRDLKRVIDLEFATGINRPIIHTSVHVPTDDRKPGLTLSMFGQYFNRNESWAELATPWVDYIARNSLLLQQGRTVADVGYFYGEEAPLTALFGEKPIADAPKRHAYDFVNAEALLEALRNDGAEIATPGGARYRALYLGGASHHMTLAVLRKLAALVEGGATVVGARPMADPGLATDAAEFAGLVDRLWPTSGQALLGRGRLIAATDIDAVLDRMGVTPDFSFAGKADSEILYLHRRSEAGDSYFVNNRKDRIETGEARFRIAGKLPELFQPETGQVRPLSYRIEGSETVVPLTLTADEAIHIVFRKPATTRALTIPAVATRELAVLDGPWQVAFEAGRGAPATTVLPSLASLDTHSAPGIRYFSGIATYRRDFTAPQGWRKGQPLFLDLGEAREVAEVILNGKHAGYTWNAPYRIDVSAQMRPGRNELEIRVANLWVNRMIGDKQPGAEKITWVSSVSYSAKARTRRSGLIGPVTLRSQR